MIETPSRILVVDDEPSITESASYALKKEGYETESSTTARTPSRWQAPTTMICFMLDIMLPGMDGYELCRRLRLKTTAPVLFLLSARDTELDKVVGLEIGVDDYPPSPSACELIARVRALLRRGQGGEFPGASNSITASGITLTRTPTPPPATTARST